MAAFGSGAGAVIGWNTSQVVSVLLHDEISGGFCASAGAFVGAIISVAVAEGIFDPPPPPPPPPPALPV